MVTKIHLKIYLLSIYAEVKYIHHRKQDVIQQWYPGKTDYWSINVVGLVIYNLIAPDALQKEKLEWVNK